MGILRSFDILLSDHEEVYHPGGCIAGSVDIVLDAPLEIQGRTWWSFNSLLNLLTSISNIADNVLSDVREEHKFKATDFLH